MKKILIITGCLICGIVFLKLLWKDPSLPKTSSADVGLDQSTASITQPFKDKFLKAYSDISANEKTVYAHELNTPSSMMEAALSFDEYARTFKDADTSKDKEIISLRKKAITALIASQKKIFPMLRKQYFEYSKSLLWKVDIDLELSGSNHNVLTFIGGRYATNMRKQETMDGISDVVKALRFKQINFKWIKHDDEFTYYSVNSPSDVAFK